MSASALRGNERGERVIAEAPTTVPEAKQS
jgi:hypothetical protein